MEQENTSTELAVIDEIEEAEYEQVENEDMPTGAVPRDVEVEFSDKEKIDMGNAMTELVSEINELESAKKSSNASYTSQIKVKHEQLTELSNELKGGKRLLTKACKKVKDYENKVIIYYDYFSGEELAREDMQEEDFQSTIYEMEEEEIFS